MTKSEKKIIFNALRSAAKQYADQKIIFEQYMNTDPRFPMHSQVYQRSQGAFLALKRLCISLGIDAATMIETLLEENDI